MSRAACLTGMVVLALVNAVPAQEPDQPPSPIIGVWASLDRHIAMGSLFQPVHGVRKREGIVCFEQDGAAVKGYAVVADHADITHQERWTDGRTEFRNVTFQDGTLTFDFDFEKWRIEAGPIAVEDGQLENAGAVRVKARLVGDRLVGTWGVFVADGTEVFRGEWEATRMPGAQAPVIADAPPVAQPARLVSGLVRAEEAVPTRGDWGQWLRHFRGDTGATEGLEVLAVTVLPGQSPHPPHQHVEEEFLILTEGSGTWHLDGREFPARKGDVVYAASGITHAITNTGDVPMTYYMLKWDSKGARVEVPVEVQPPADAEISNTPGGCAENPPESEPPAVANKAPQNDVNPRADVQKELIPGGLAHSRGGWVVVSGKVRVLNGYMIAFEDGTEVALENGPELEQQAKIGDTLYPAGKEAAEFLTRLIGDRVVTMYVNADTDEYRRGDRRTGLCFVDDTNLGLELILNGWAIADHSLMVPAEIIARRNKRGLWRGEFVPPDRWRKGERLPGELAARHNALPPAPAAAPAATIHDHVVGSINHGGGDTVWLRVTGPVTVLDARTIRYSDGTRIELDVTIPNPGQMAMNGDTLYSCGKEGAEFLRELIGNRPVMCFHNDDGDGPWMGFVGNTNIERALIVNGWALADHSSLHADEVIAREDLRGLWRGKFVHPDDWLAGVRLPGEAPPAPIIGAQQAAELIAEYGHSRAALAALIPRIIHDVPDIRQLALPGDAFTDDHLNELLQLKSLEELNLDACGGITVPGLASLQKLPHLKRLVLPWRSTDAALESISGISTLEFLAFYFAEATDAGLVHLKRLQNLRYLCLHRASVTDAGLAHLRELPNLAVLEFGGIPISDGGVPHLAACDQLEFLDVSDTEITNAGAAQLAGLTRLRVLKLPDRVTVDVRNRLQQALPALKFDGNPQDVLSNAEMN